MNAYDSPIAKQIRAKGMKSPSNKSRIGNKKGSYSFDRYGFVRRDRLEEPKKHNLIEDISALEPFRTGKVKRIKPGGKRCFV